MQQLQEKFELVFNPQQVELLNRALAYATKMHSNQFRESGEPYITHPIAVATILFDLGLDCATLAAALLHDCVEDTAATDEEIRKLFGDEIAELVVFRDGKGHSRYNHKACRQTAQYAHDFVAERGTSACDGTRNAGNFCAARVTFGLKLS